jgi:hypothetical protein
METIHPSKHSHTLDSGAAISLRAALDQSAPGQHEAKHLIEREWSLFAAALPGIPYQPVLLAGNRPGTLPHRLFSAVSDHTGIPLLEFSTRGGFSLEEVWQSLPQVIPDQGLNVGKSMVLLTDLESLDPHQIHALCHTIKTPGKLWKPQGANHEPPVIFWAGTMTVHPPVKSRMVSQAESTELFVAVGKNFQELTARRVSKPADESARLLAVLQQHAFAANAWLLPYQIDDFRHMLSPGNPASPLAPFLAFCESHGVTLEVDADALEEIARLAATTGGGCIDAPATIIRESMEPAFAIIADPSSEIATIKLTAKSIHQDEWPGFIPGRRQARVVAASLPPAHPSFPQGFPKRPALTANSNPETRLARAEDLSALFIKSTQHDDADESL